MVDSGRASHGPGPGGPHGPMPHRGTWTPERGNPMKTALRIVIGLACVVALYYLVIMFAKSFT